MTSHALNKPSLCSMLTGLVKHVTRYELPEPASVGWYHRERRFDIQVSLADQIGQLLAWVHSMPEVDLRIRRLSNNTIHLTVDGRLLDGSPVQLYTSAPGPLAAKYAATLADHREIPVTLAELRTAAAAS